MRIIRFIKKNYKIINIIILCICIYVLAFPSIAVILEKISPKLTKCPYLILTGKPCPLCGGTRFIKNLPMAIYDISYMFNFFGFISIIVILEIPFRIVNIIEKKHSDKKIKIDILLHIFLILIYIFYILWYIL